MRRILCIWLPNWPVQRLVVVRPELKDRAIVLHARDARRGQCVVCCSAAATARGIRAGMPLADATARMEQAESREQRRSFPSAPYLEEHDSLADREALGQLAVWCERFSPLVGFDAADQPCGLLLDVTGLGHLWGNEDALARDVLQAFCQRDYMVRIAIADTVGTAWAVARTRNLEPDNLEPDNLEPDNLERDNLERDIENSDLFIIPRSGNREALHPLPVHALRLADRAVELLHQLGVFTVGQLAVLPRASLSSRFGDQLLRRWDQATGAIPEMIVAHRPSPPPQAQRTLEHPTVRRDMLDQVLTDLIGQLVRILVAQNQGAVELLCQLDCDRQLDWDHGAPVRIEVGLFRPTATARHLMELIGMQLDQLRLPGPVHHISIQCVTTAALEDRQHQILDCAPRDAPRELTRLVDRISSRLGRDRVVRAQLRADAQAEYAYRYVPLTGHRSTNRNRAVSHRHAVAKPGQRPLRLYVPPLALQVIAVAPQGPPVSFVYQGQHHRIGHHWGPERIETGWWRGRSIRRDYYRVENQHGNRFWLFRRLGDGKWFLQGAFE